MTLIDVEGKVGILVFVTNEVVLSDLLREERPGLRHATLQECEHYMDDDMGNHELDEHPVYFMGKGCHRTRGGKEVVRMARSSSSKAPQSMLFVPTSQKVTPGSLVLMILDEDDPEDG